MTDASTLIKHCRSLGANFYAGDNRLRIEAPQPLPRSVITLLKKLRVQVMVELEKERRDNRDCWVLEQWRQVSIPEWRCVLQDSIVQHDIKREDYARWMLRDILLDPEYEEPKL